MAKVAARDRGVGWTMEQSYVDNEEVVTEKPQTTWPGRGLPFSLGDRTIEVIKWFVISLTN